MLRRITRGQITPDRIIRDQIIHAKLHEVKDTILRSTINDYFENEPDERLTAWV